MERKRNPGLAIVGWAEARALSNCLSPPRTPKPTRTACREKDGVGFARDAATTFIDRSRRSAHSTAQKPLHIVKQPTLRWPGVSFGDLRRTGLRRFPVLPAKEGAERRSGAPWGVPCEGTREDVCETSLAPCDRGARLSALHCGRSDCIRVVVPGSRPSAGYESARGSRSRPRPLVCLRRTPQSEARRFSYAGDRNDVKEKRSY